MKQHIFRQYDIRGIIGIDFDTEDIPLITRAFLQDARQSGYPCARVAVGYDGRTHSPALAKAVMGTIQAAGAQVVDIGLVPTPLMYFTMHRQYADLGIMITASHNGPEYNGLKLCRGVYSYAGDDIVRLAQLALSGMSNTSSGVSTSAGITLDIVSEYVEYMATQFADLQGSSISAVFDAGHGVAGPVIERLIKRLQLQNVRTLYTQVDGSWPERGPDPSQPANVRMAAQTIWLHHLRWGGSLDGDGDRLVVLDEQGAPCTGDRLLALWIDQAIAMFGYPIAGMTFIGDSKCSLVVDQVAQAHQVRMIRVATGHTWIKRAIREYQALCAGELSCHFFFADQYFGYDDGIYAWLRMARCMQRVGHSLSSLMARIPLTHEVPEQRIPCAEQDKTAIMHKVHEYVQKHHAGSYQTYDGIRYEGSDGWWLIRPAHTQPVLCLRAESMSATGLKELQKELEQVLQYAGYQEKLCVLP